MSRQPGRDEITRRVGMVGGGQLARMTWQAAISLDVDLCVLAASADDSAALVAPWVQIGDPDAFADMVALAEQVEVVTFDHELVDLELLAKLEADGHVVRPGPDALQWVVDKLALRRLCERVGVPTPRWIDLGATIEGDAVARAGAELGWPLVLKASRGGYDGRGVWVCADRAEADAVVAGAMSSGTRLLAEPFVALRRELAALLARRPGGELVTYPVVESVQVDGICHEVLAGTAVVDEATTTAALEIARLLAAEIGVVGLLAVELFETDEGLLLNELASRPHNTGHYTIEGCATSQFENHLRAVLDLPLGSTELVVPAAVMVNVLGRDEGSLSARLAGALAVPGASVHLYGKGARPGRKLGHVTVVADDVGSARERARAAARALEGET